jgi:hypothetical protein
MTARGLCSKPFASKAKAAEPGAYMNLGYAQRIREGFSLRSSEARCLSFNVDRGKA